MMKISALLLVLLLALSVTVSQASLPAAVDGESLPSLAPVLERVTPSVVNIYTQTRVRINNPLINDPFFRRFFNIPEEPQERVSQSLGSGVIVDSKMGYVLTNNHVISGADEISVTLADGRSFEAEVIGTDPDTDLAMVRIPAENLQALPMADSSTLRVGDFVVAVGNPFGLGQTVTSGIVSALGRAGFRGLEFQNFIQTDASINPGNSGGALVNLRGELVGINSAIFTPSGGNIGIGFAIPTAIATYVIKQLAEYGEVRRGTLGVYVQDLTPELAGALGIENTKGALVAEVMKGAAADKAGLEAGDVVTQVATYPVHTMQDFYLVEGQLPIGEEQSLNYLRDGKARSARLSARELPMLQGGDLDRRLVGAVFEELPAKMLSQQLRGVLLSALDQQSRLARFGLRPGDILTGVNQQAVRGLAEFEELVQASRGPLLVQLWRNGGDYVARID